MLCTYISVPLGHSACKINMITKNEGKIPKPYHVNHLATATIQPRIQFVHANQSLYEKN